MSEDIKSLSELDTISSEDVAAVEITAPRVAIRDDLGRSYATGKRKDAVARVWIKPGSGKIKSMPGIESSAKVTPISIIIHF